MANQFIARKGLIALADSQITGSLNISQNIVAGGTVQATFDTSTATAISGAFDSVSSSFASERLKNTTDTLTGDLTVTGTITAQEFHTEFVSASIIYESGSTKFGNSTDDVHSFTGSIRMAADSDLTVDRTLYVGHIDSGADNILAINAQSGFGSISLGSTYTQTSRLRVNYIDSGLGNGSLRIANDGKVGIGSTDPASTLDIQTNGSAGIARISADANGAVYSANGDVQLYTNDAAYSTNIYSANKAGLLFRVQNDGNVGIGTDSPGEKLTVNGSIGLQYSGTQTWHIYGDSSNGIRFTRSGIADRLVITSDGDVGIGNPSPVEDSINGGFSFILDGSDTNFTQGPLLQFNAHNGTIRPANTSARIQIEGNDVHLNTNWANNVFLANGGGKVGIGTTSPSHKTHIHTGGGNLGGTVTYGTTTTGLVLTQDSGNSQYGNGIWFYNNALPSGMASTRENVSNWGTDLRFYTHPSAIANQNTLTEVMRIDSAGYLGIGNLGGSASAPIHFYKDSVDVNGNNDVTLLLQNTLYNSSQSGDTYENKIALGWANHYAAGISAYKQTVNVTGLKFYTEWGYNTPSEVMRLTGDGAMVIKDGTNAELSLKAYAGADSSAYIQAYDNSASTFKNLMIYGKDIIFRAQTTTESEKFRILASGGVTFNGDTAAANALDDYEEGDWTPVLTASTSAPTVGYAYRSGDYTKIGNIVFCRFGFKVNSISGGSGTVQITGLPYTHTTQGAYQEPNFSVQVGALTTASNAYKTRMFVKNNSTIIEGRIADNIDTQWNLTEITSTTWIIAEFFYHVN